MHRVVIFRDAKSASRQVQPYVDVRLADAEDLWEYLENYEEKPAGRCWRSHTTATCQTV